MVVFLYLKICQFPFLSVLQNHQYVKHIHRFFSDDFRVLTTGTVDMWNSVLECSKPYRVNKICVSSRFLENIFRSGLKLISSNDQNQSEKYVKITKKKIKKGKSVAKGTKGKGKRTQIMIWYERGDQFLTSDVNLFLFLCVTYWYSFIF